MSSSNRSWKVGSHTSHRWGVGSSRCRVHGCTRLDLATYLVTLFKGCEEAGEEMGSAEIGYLTEI